MNPIYPNCFDMLTTHGVIADDLVGYVTGEPSPYLQNYVAQRGGIPSVPGQVLPDPLPHTPQKVQPMGDVYQKPEVVPAHKKKDKWSTFSKIAAAGLLVGLGVFGILKGKDLYNKIAQKSGGSDWGARIKEWFKPKAETSSNEKGIFKRFGDWISKPFKSTPEKPNVLKRFGAWVSKPFKSTPEKPNVFKRFGAWVSKAFKS